MVSAVLTLDFAPMKYLLSSAMAIFALATVGPAQSKPKAPPKELPCPVMPDHKVNIAKATKEKMFADYKGRRYFFCCAGCPGPFKENPAKYAKTQYSIPTPKPARKA
jgi:YHS domain-containing protein